MIVIYGRELAALALPNLVEELPLIINGEKMVVAILAVFLLKKKEGELTKNRSLIWLKTIKDKVKIGNQFHLKSGIIFKYLMNMAESG